MQKCLFLAKCTHPSQQVSHKIPDIAGPKFTKCLQDVEGSSCSLSMLDVLWSSRPFSNASANNKGGECQLVTVSCHKISCYGNVPWAWPKFAKFLATKTFSSVMLTQQSTLRSVHPLSNERGDIWKENQRQNISQSLASQCLSGGIIMPCIMSAIGNSLLKWQCWQPLP